MAQGISSPDPFLSHTHLFIRKGRATTTHHTHHQVSLMVSRNTTLVSSLGCALGQPVRQASACVRDTNDLMQRISDTWAGISQNVEAVGQVEHLLN